MRAVHLAEAAKAVERIAAIDDLLRRGLREPSYQKIRVNPGAGGVISETNISRRLYAILDREWRADLASERAELVRRLNQLGVSL